MTDTKETTADIIKRHLVSNQETIAVAESVTAGQLQFQLSQATGAEEFFQGGITTYNIGQKSALLHVEPIHANECNCVSERVAGQMALNVCTLFGSDWGIGITGYATPVPESGNKLYCFFAIAYRGGIKHAGKLAASKSPPAKVQEMYAEKTLKVLAELLA